MKTKTDIRWTTCLPVAALMLILTAVPCPGADTPAARAIIHTVDKHLQSNPDYQPGDLLCQANVEPIMDELLIAGFKPRDSEELYDSILPNGDRLVKLLRTPEGRKFMRQVKTIPHAYDRLERLSWVLEGRQLLTVLVNDPKGAEQFSKLTTVDGLKQLSEMSDDARLKNISRSTGHVHTADQLIERLKKSLEPAPKKIDPQQITQKK